MALEIGSGFSASKTVRAIIPFTMNEVAVTIDVTGLISTNGAEERTRTSTGISPLPPQGSVSTNSTTSAHL